MSDHANYSKLPPLRDIAETLRESKLAFEDVALMYGVPPTTLSSRLYNAGYGQSGHPLRVEARTSGVLEQVGPVFVTGGIGGGDYQGLPLRVVPHTRRRKIFIGLDWSTSPATGPIWRWS